MIGHDIPQSNHQAADEGGGVIRLQVDQLNHVPNDPFGTTLNSLSLTVRAGEIVGIAGVSGNGQNELMRMVSGETLLKSPSSGQVALMGENAGHLAPMQRRRLGFAFVPEERLGRGAVPDLNLAYNSLLTGLEKGLTKLGFIRFAKMKAMADECISTNDVRCGGNAARASSLSGGNLQKFIVGREMALVPELLVLSQPTWGVDVGAAAAIRQALITLRNSGTAILIVSEELEELFEVTDRLYVMFDGHMSDSLATRSTDAEQIGEWMTGTFLSPSAVTHAEL
jgi:simple sugar transport system ATP-binding protein